MKQLITMLCIVLFASGTVFSQETETAITISGELKTGLFWYDRTQYDSDGQEYDHAQGAFIHNAEDTNWARGVTDYNVYNNEPGRFRLNFDVQHGNVGTKFRFEAAAADIRNPAPLVKLSYAFAYGYFWDRQFKVSAGRMGDSPWGTGGPEMWRELDTVIGMRFEMIPSFIPFIDPGRLNFGFVLNYINGGRDAMMQKEAGRGIYWYDLLEEMVFGLSYFNDWFLLRASYRLDSAADSIEGETLIYRAEERVLQRFVPGLQIFANGIVQGMNRKLDDDEILAGVNPSSLITTENWVYIQYQPELFTAQLRLGNSTTSSEQGQYFVRASFYYNLFNNLVSVGPAFEYANDYGPDSKGDTYLRWYIEPMIRFNFAPGCYVAMVYRFQDDVETRHPSSGDSSLLRTATNWVNLRVVLTF